MKMSSQRNKPAMVLIHGLLSDHRMWQGQMEELDTAYHVFNWDLPGFGGEPPLGEGKKGLLTETADWLAGKMAAEGLKGAYLAGYSLGTTVALKVALRHPEAVGRLALVAGAARWGGGGRSWAAHCPGPAYFLLKLKLRRRLARLLDTEEKLRTAYDMIERAHTATGRALLAEILGSDLTSELSALKIPALVISGGEDPLATPDRADGLQKALPGAERLIFTDGGHYICITHAAELVSALTRFGR